MPSHNTDGTQQLIIIINVLLVHHFIALLWVWSWLQRCTTHPTLLNSKDKFCKHDASISLLFKGFVNNKHDRICRKQNTYKITCTRYNCSPVSNCRLHTEHTKQWTWNTLLMAFLTRSSGHIPILQPEHFVPNRLKNSGVKQCLKCYCNLIWAVFISNSPEKIGPAKYFPFPPITLFAKKALALATLHTFNVPVLVQHFMKVSLLYHLITSSTRYLLGRIAVRQWNRHHPLLKTTIISDYYRYTSRASTNVRIFRIFYIIFGYL